MIKEIENRRSVREFSNKEVEDYKIEDILKAGLLSPSARKQEAWKILVVRNKDLIKKLKGASKYTIACLTANILLIPCIVKNKVTCLEYVEQDLAMLSENILLEIVNQGLAGVYLGIYPKQDRYGFISKVLNLDENIIPFSIIALGYPLYENSNHPKDINIKDYIEYYN